MAKNSKASKEQSAAPAAPSVDHALVAASAAAAPQASAKPKVATKRAPKAAKAPAEASASESAADVQQSSGPKVDEVPKGFVRVAKCKVNMALTDGTQLLIGQPAVLSQEEHDRLKADLRGPFWE